MPVQEGPIGPFPEGTDPDEYDRLRRRLFWAMPSGLYVLGSTDGGERRNGMTIVVSGSGDAAMQKITTLVARGFVSTLRASHWNTRPLGGAGLRPAIVSAIL